MSRSSRFITNGLSGAFSLFMALHVSVGMAETLSDPMRPPNASVYKRSATTVPQYQLSSILISPEHRSAIINGKNVGVGDRVGNARVTRIQGNEVTITIAGKARTLTLLPLSIKKPAEASRQ